MKVSKKLEKQSEDLIQDRINPHVIKAEFLGDKNLSKFDLYKHADTGEILIFRKEEIGNPISTKYYIK